VIHRVGRIAAGENIVLVLTASQHRQAAVSAAEFLMDYLKATRRSGGSRAEGTAGTGWVDARHPDDAAARAGPNPDGGDARKRLPSAAAPHRIFQSRHPVNCSRCLISSAMR